MVSYMQVKNIILRADAAKKLKLIIKLGRFRFLLGGFLLYSIGILLAIISGSSFSAELYIFGYSIFISAHLSMNYSNIYFDINSDKNTLTTSISGGSKILIKNPDLKKICLSISLILMIISLVLAVIFILLYSYTITFFFFVLFGTLLGFFYAAPPIKLAYRGLGEIANIINMGLIMPGFGYWVLKGEIDVFYFVFAIGVFFYGLVFIISVEIPDMEGDKISNKNTIVVKKGRKFSYIILLISLLCATIYYLILTFLKLYIEYLNYIGIFVLSLIPLIVAIEGWLKKPFERTIALKIATRNVMTLSFFMILVILYLIIILFI